MYTLEVGSVLSQFLRKSGCIGVELLLQLSYEKTYHNRFLSM